MTRMCTSPELIPIYNLKINPPNFDEFEKDIQNQCSKPNVMKYDNDNDILSNYLEAERDLENPRGNKLWHSIRSKYKLQNYNMIHDFYKQRKERNKPIRWTTNKSDYLEKKAIPTLIKGVTECLKIAKIRGILMTPRYGIDAVDFVSEYVYNHHPYYPERTNENKNIFDIDTFQKIAAQSDRGIWPSSWEWDFESAVIFIQKNVRGWLVRKQPEVQRLRMFHKANKFPWRVPMSSIYPDNIYDLLETYSDVNLTNDKRGGPSYVDCCKYKMMAREEAQQKKVTEDKIKQLIKKMATSQLDDLLA